MVTDISARNCPYSRDLISIPRKSSPTVTGSKLLQDLREWISPPDPSINHNIACGTQHERTSEWLFKEITFKEWESKGSLLWIHGKRTFLPGVVQLYLTASFVSGLGEERPLVRHSMRSPYTHAHILNQFCNHPAYRSSAWF